MKKRWQEDEGITQAGEQKMGDKNEREINKKFQKFISVSVTVSLALNRHREGSK